MLSPGSGRARRGRPATRAPMTDQKNTILAIVLSALVFLVWQYFVGLPQMEKQRQIAQQQTQQPAQPVPGPDGRTAPVQQGGAPAVLPGQPVAQPETLTREQALAKSARIAIDTPRLSGSVALAGGRVDDLALVKYRETVDPNSPPIVLLAPSGSPHPFYAEFGWVAAPGAALKLPGRDSLWRQEGAGTLGIGRPVTLTFDNGAGLVFRRT